MSDSIVPLKREREDSDYESDVAESVASNHDADEEDLPDDEIEIEDGNDSDEEMDEWDRSESRYDAGEEVMPNVPAYHSSFTKSQNEVEDLLQSFPDVTKYIPYDETLDQLREMRQEAWDDSAPPPVKIALLGDAGKGKSSLINSILDTPDLADTGSSGQSCTNVVFEYACAPNTQETLFEAHIVYHTSDKIKQFFQEQVKNYRHAVFDTREDWTEDERFENDLLKRTARELLHDLFCHHEDFKTVVATHVWFQKTRNEDINAVVNRLTEFAARIIELQTENKRDTTVAAKSGATLRAKLAPFIRTREKRRNDVGRAIWPLVEAIKIGVKGARVVQNVTLVDMPGILPSKVKAGVLRKPGKGDRNRFRDGLSYEYLKLCNGAWVVTELGRALDEANVQRMLKDTFDLFTSLDSVNVALICTHSDVKIDAKTTADLKSKRFDVSEVALWDSNLKDIRKKEKELVKAIGKKSQHYTLNKMKAELQELQEKIKEVEIKKKAKLMILRNADVKQRAAKVFKELVPSGAQLNVFCVSNDEYKKWKHPDSSDNQTMDIEVTGIPAIRAFLLERAAPRVQRHFEIKIDDGVPSLIETTKIWCDREPVKNAEKIIQKAIEPQQSVENIVNNLFVARTTALKECVLNDIDQNQKHLSTQAMAAHNAWRPRSGAQKNGESGWNNQTYGAWYRHLGCYETKTQSWTSWNEQIATELRELLKNPWGRFDKKRIANGQESLKVLQGLLDDVPFMINKMHVLLPGMASLKKVIVQAQVALKNLFSEENDRQIRIVGNMWTRTIKEVPDGYILQVMKPGYARACEVRGKGKPLKAFNTLQNHLKVKKNHNPWALVMSMMDTSLSVDAKINEARFIMEIIKVFKRVEQQVRLMVEEKKKEQREDPKLSDIRNQLRAWAIDAASKHEQIKAQVNLAKEACGVDGA